MILHVTQQQTMVSFVIQKVTQALCVVELSIAKRSFFVPDLTSSNSFDKLIGVCVKDKVPVVGRICNDK